MALSLLALSKDQTVALSLLTLSKDKTVALSLLALSKEKTLALSLVALSKDQTCGSKSASTFKRPDLWLQAYWYFQKARLLALSLLALS